MTDRTMRDVSQRNPADRENVFGRVFERGPSVAADGGERDAHGDDSRDDEGAAGDDAREADGSAPSEEGAGRPAAAQRMKDVDQTPPDEDAGANTVWERGGETPPEVTEE
ncbi:MAG: hypothetical protein ABEJ90_05155 [Halobacterium sp.]